MKIIELKASNFKRLKAVHLRPKKGVQQITGRNAQGKTSVLDAVAAVFGGKKAAPLRPIRDGEEHAEIIVQTEDYTITRKWSRGAESTLVIETREGARVAGPQGVLDKLFNHVAFDPLAFTRLDAKKQAATLRELAGLDTSKIDGERARVYEERTEKSRAHKAVQAQYEAMPLVDAPDDSVVMAELLKELAEVEHGIQVHGDAQARIARYRTERDRIGVHDVPNAEKALRVAQEQLEGARAMHAQAVKDTAEIEENHGSYPLPEKQPVLDRIAEAEQVNARVAQKKLRRKTEEAMQAHGAGVDDLTKKIASIDAKKAELLAAARFPVPGLSVDGDAPTFNGVPLEQASGAEQLRVGLAVASALNPKLRVVLVRDGSLLDSEGMDLIGEWAESNDMQVLVERVANGEPIGVVIEDGEVVSEDGFSDGGAA